MQIANAQGDWQTAVVGMRRGGLSRLVDHPGQGFTGAGVARFA
jgi:hypothetical protein